jgi:ABC-type dipeptide/oligopeptide/nickel transport system permease component
MKKLFTIITIIGLLTAILPGAAFADEATVTLSQERMDEITRYLDEDEILDMQTAVRVNEYLNICEKINAEEGTQWGFMTEEDRETINEKYGLDVPCPSEITITPEEFEADLRQVVAREKVINAQAAI